MKLRRKTPKPVFGWVGVMDDEIDLKMSLVSANPPMAYGMMYPTRKEALKFYQCARRVVVKITNQRG